MDKKIKAALKANATIHNALINEIAKEFYSSYLAGSAKSDELARLLDKSIAIQTLLRFRVHNELVAQIANAQSEIEFAHAIANYDAKKPAGGYPLELMSAWHNACDGRDLKFPRLYAIAERFFFGGDNITVGEYLDITRH